jgi:hypothetical protein
MKSALGQLTSSSSSCKIVEVRCLILTFNSANLGMVLDWQIATYVVVIVEYDLFNDASAAFNLLAPNRPINSSIENGFGIVNTL